MQKLKLALIAGILTVLAVGCSNEKENTVGEYRGDLGYKVMFDVVYESGASAGMTQYAVVVDRKTDIVYFTSEDGGITPVYNSDGTVMNRTQYEAQGY